VSATSKHKIETSTGNRKFVQSILSDTVLASSYVRKLQGPPPLLCQLLQAIKAGGLRIWGWWM